MKLIDEWQARLPKPVTIWLRETEDARSAQFQTFGELLSRHAPKVQILSEKAEGLPALIPGNLWHYHLVPEGAEFKPFLELVAMIHQGPGDLPRLDIPAIKALKWPSHIKMYVTNYCPHCREAVTRIMPLPLFNPLIHISIIDGALFPDLAAADKVRSVPTMICNDRFRWTGPVRMAELMGVMTVQDPSQLGMETFKRMIQEGQTDRLADMMLESNRISAGFIEALMHADFQTRLGAMVVFEDIAERRPELARKALEPIGDKLEGADESVRGDMIYLIGKAGDPGWSARLEGWRTPVSSAEFRGIVDEAIENLKSDKDP